MLFLIVCNVIFLILLILLGKRDSDGNLKSDYVGNIPAVMGIFNLLFFAIPMIFFLKIESRNLPNEEKITATKEIYSLDLSNDIHSDFYLGTGNVTNDMTYYYYVKNDDGTYSLENQSAKNLTIQLIEENEKPRIVYKRIKEVKELKKTMPDIFTKLSINGLLGADGEWKPQSYISDLFFFIAPANEKSSIVIYIPQGSIKNNYDPNVKK